MLDVYKFDSGSEGPNVLILGAIHGDEVCGPKAMARVIEAFEAQDLVLLKGAVTFIPVCNPKAYEQNVRFVDRNLNRYMSPISAPRVYEDDLTNFLCPYLRQADVLLDIHSYFVGGAPFIFVDGARSPDIPFAKSLGPDHMVYGFTQAYQNADEADSKEAALEAMGTTEYMVQFGGYGVTLECGQHQDPQSVVVAERAIYNGLKFLEMIEGDVRNTSNVELVRVEKVFYAEDTLALSDSWVHLQPIKQGTEIARYEDGRVIAAEQDCVIFLPRACAQPGQELFYLGQIED